jgi:release factor glutamine methyltransferase
VFQPISDSWMLAACLRREPLRTGRTVLDLCSGSGMLAVAAALRGASVTAVDVARRAGLAIELNALLNGVGVEVRLGDLFSAVPGRRFDVIVTNPPYVPSSSRELPSSGPARAWEAGPTGRAFIDRICAQAVDHLNPGGVLLMVHSTVCGEAETMNALADHGLTPAVVWRHRGHLGPLMRDRAEWLRRDGRLPADDGDEVVVFRAERAA